MSSKRVSVFVIGASHAGLGVSHKLLRQNSKVSVTLINPSDEYYFSISAPRFLVKPESIPPSKYLYNIPETFNKYPDGCFTFVKGLATKIDYTNKSVLVTKLENYSTKGDVISITFDYLVLASGSTTPATLGQGSLKLPFKATAFEDTRDAISEAQKKLEAATRIVIGGAGPLGVEFAGELAEAPGSKKIITLVSKTHSLLADGTKAIQRTAESLLRRKDVEILKNVTVNQVEQDP